jgi:hypothetical protein
MVSISQPSNESIREEREALVIGNWSLAAEKPFSPRLLKKVQMQGGTPEPERGVLEVRRSEWRGGPTPQMGLFQ